MLLKNYKLKLIKLILFFTILTPSIRIGSLPGFRLEQILILMTTIYAVFRVLAGKKVRIQTSSFTNIYILFPIFIIISSFVGSIKGYTPIPNDYFELYKVFLYAAVFFITSTFIDSDEKRIQILSSIVLYSSFSAIIAITQYFDFMGLNSKYIPIIAPTQFKTLMPGHSQPRVVGLSGNPNVYAVIAGIGFLLALWFFIETRKKKYVIPLTLNFIGSLMTLSRTGFVFLGAASLVMVFSNLSVQGLNYKVILSGKIKKKPVALLLFSLLIVASITVALLEFVPEDLLWRLRLGLNVSQDNSWQARIQNWNEAKAFFLNSPLFGIGPAKNFFTISVDNEWLLLLARYGVVGTFVLSLSFISPLFDKRFYKNKYRSIYYGLIVGMSLYMIPASIYHSFQLMIIVLVILASVLQERKEIVVT